MKNGKWVIEGKKRTCRKQVPVERVMGFEPTNGSLGSYCLTTWLHPHMLLPEYFNDVYRKKQGRLFHTFSENRKGMLF